MNRLRAGLENAKEDLLRTHTELAAVQAEADRVSHALTGVKHDLERQGRTCKTLEATIKELRAQLLAAQETQRVPEEVSRFLATTAEVQLQQPEITDDHPFIVLTETKLSSRCIPVWIGTLLTGLGSKIKHM